MSGRTISGYRDGKPIRGFRKTSIERKRSRAVPRETPEHRLRFQLPSTVAFGLAVGPVSGLIGVYVEPESIVVVTGKDRDFICRQAAALIKGLAAGRPPGRIHASLSRGTEAPAEFEIAWMSGDPAVMIQGTAMRPFFAEGPSAASVFRR